MVMSTGTAVSTYARTHTATHLADVILGSIADILATLGIDPTRLFADWPTDQSAISAWISEGSLKCVALQCSRPDGTVNPIFEFPVSYTQVVSGIGSSRRIGQRWPNIWQSCRVYPVGLHTSFSAASTGRTRHNPAGHQVRGRQ